MVTKAVVKKDGKFEYFYLKNVPVFYACVHKPKKMFEVDPNAKNPSTHEYSVNVFVDSDTRDMLEDKILLNKTLFEVGKDKNKKRKIKFPLEDDKGNELYAPVKGMHGFTITRKSLNNNGDPVKIVVVDKDGNEFKEDLGNMTKVNIRCWGYRNKEDMLVVSLDLVQVLEHVPYEGGAGGRIVDDELGLDIERPKTEESKPNPAADSDDMDDDDDPF